MRRSTTLLHVNEDTTDQEVLATAHEAAARNIYLDIVLCALMPLPRITAYGFTPYAPMNLPENWTENLRKRHADVKRRSDEIAKLLSSTDVAGGVRQIASFDTDLEARIAESARYGDQAFFASNLRDDKPLFDKALHGVLFSSPIGAMLNTAPGFEPDHVMVAWDESATAARAIHLALPLIRHSTSVTIVCVDALADVEGEKHEPGATLATWLARHGCKASVSQFPSGGLEIGSVIKDRAMEMGADLVVMGAYGRSRMQQAVFGGTTRFMVEQTHLPIFLAH